MKNKYILEINNISKSFSDNLVFDNINLKIKKGEVISIIGKSGNGKSTLLKCINGLEKIDNGEIIFNGININNYNYVDLRQNIGIVFQDYNLFEHLTVIENLTIGLNKIKKYSQEKSNKLAIEMLKKVKLLEKQNNYPDELSGGQRQRISIARTMLMKPKIILLDEPTSALDDDAKTSVLELINELVNENMTLIIVSHEMDFVKKVSDKVFQFNKHNLKNVVMKESL